MAKNVESLYNLLSKMSEKLTDVVTDATELNQQAAQYGGEIARIISEQMNQYFIPSITKMVNDLETPGDLAGVVKFLDSCPLALVREEPAPLTEVPQDIVPESAPVLDNPVGTSQKPVENPVTELPHNVSYNTIKEPAVEEAPVEPVAAEAPVEAPAEELPMEPVEAPVMESVIREAEEEKVEAPQAGIWKVIRQSKMAAAIGEDLANLDGQCVNEFNSEEEANANAAMLNDTVLPAEFELFGTEYVVKHDEAAQTEVAVDKREDGELEEARNVPREGYPLAGAIAKRIKEVNPKMSKEELLSWLDSVLEEVPHAEDAKKVIRDRVEEAPSTKKAIYALADFMQAGYGDKVIK